MKRRSSYLLSVILTLLIIVVGCSSNSEKTSKNSQTKESKEKVVLKVNTFLPVDHPFTVNTVPMWKEKVEAATNGEVTVDWIGGPEALPPKDQLEAVRSGIIDVAFGSNSYYGNIIPATDSLTLSNFTPKEERENGYFDYMSKLYQENNVIYLGRMLSEEPFYLWSNEKIDSLNGFKGTRFRASPTYFSMMEKLGITPVEIVAADVYTSLERKMVDGFGFPILGPRDSAWTEVAKFLIKEPFLNQNSTILMNVSTFQSLSEENQKKVIQATADYENEMAKYFKDQNEKELKVLKESGVEIVTFSHEESKKFRKIWTDAAWADLEKKAPDNIKELKKLLKK